LDLGQAGVHLLWNFNQNWIPKKLSKTFKSPIFIGAFELLGRVVGENAVEPFGMLKRLPMWSRVVVLCFVDVVHVGMHVWTAAGATY
jgi:hypothetical protein